MGWHSLLSLRPEEAVYDLFLSVFSFDPCASLDLIFTSYEILAECRCQDSNREKERGPTVG